VLEGHSKAEDETSRAVAVFVHGIFGSNASWANLLDFVREDIVVRRCYDLVFFSYTSPAVSWNPLKRIPALKDVADLRATALVESPLTADAERIVLLGHSQGGLVIHRYLADALRAGNGEDLRRIRGVVQFATPNTGSQLLLSVRRGFGRLGLWNNPQEKTLRPLDEEIDDMRRVILRQVLYAEESGPSKYPIPFRVYAGDSDRIVPAQSARWVFPDARTLPGDHFSIIKPSDKKADVCNAVKGALRLCLHRLESDTAAISTQSVDPTRQSDVDAILSLQGAEFTANARVRREELVRWLKDYDALFGIKLSLIAARIASEIVGFVMFHESPEFIVIDYVAANGAGRAETIHGWPTAPLHALILPRLLARIRDRAERSNLTVVFEVEDPANEQDANRKRRARARIVHFARLGARLVEGFSFPSPNMDRVPLSETESPYLLMVASTGPPRATIDKQTLSAITRFLYLKWYRNWFSSSKDNGKLDDYLARLNERVAATIPASCKLSKQWRDAPAP
jgi:pimeloyl-ACP methyl ester carboxylesterase